MKDKMNYKASILSVLVCFSLVLPVNAQNKSFLPIVSTGNPEYCIVIDPQLIDKVNQVISPGYSNHKSNSSTVCPENSLSEPESVQIAQGIVSLPVNKVTHVFTLEDKSKSLDPNSIANIIWLRRIQAMNNQIQSGKLGNIEISNLIIIYRDPTLTSIRIIPSVLCKFDPLAFTSAKLLYNYTTYEQVANVSMIRHWSKIQWSTLPTLACPGLVNFQNIELSSTWFMLTPVEREATEKEAQSNINKWEGKLTLQPMGLQPAYTTDAQFTAFEYGSVVILVIIVATVFGPEVYLVFLAS